MPTSFDELDDDLPSVDTGPEEVELDVDVLAPVVENQCRGPILGYPKRRS